MEQGLFKVPESAVPALPGLAVEFIFFSKDQNVIFTAMKSPLNPEAGLRRFR